MTGTLQSPGDGSTAVVPPPHSPEWVSEAPRWTVPWEPPTAPGWGPAGPPPTGPSELNSGFPSPVPNTGGRRGLAALLVAALVSAAIGVGLGNRLARSATTPTAAPPATPATFPASGPGGSANPTTPAPPATGAGSAPSPPIAPAPADAAAVAARVTPGIVDINTQLSYQRAAAAGTGMVVTASGEVITNNHVVEGSTSITVTVVSTGRTYAATVVGTDPTEDIAVLELRGASGLTTVPTGDSDQVVAGDAVVALGNAGGRGGAPTVVTGTVAAIDQTITASDQSGANAETLDGLIETDAPIAAGDSGGPLANARGLVIGMDTAASNSRRFNSGAIAAFAIPINHALDIAQQIVSGRASATIHIGLPGFLGVGLAINGSGGGALVSSVASGTPASSAGLTPGSVITAVGGATVTSAPGLTAALQGRHPGDRVTLTWTDQSGASHTKDVTLASGPAD